MAAWQLVAALVGLVGMARRRKAPSPGTYPPPRPPALHYPSPAERDAWFGPIVWTPAPTASNPEAVDVIKPPALVSVEIHELGKTARLNIDAARSFALVLDDLRRDGQTGLLRTYSGTYVPRLVRGSTKTLSSHSYGTAIDMNAPQAPLGTLGDADQWALAHYFVRRGWYWGGWFKNRPDPHHFEWVTPPGQAVA